jgi:RHS repeat-associated protein
MKQNSIKKWYLCKAFLIILVPIFTIGGCQMPPKAFIQDFNFLIAIYNHPVNYTNLDLPISGFGTSSEYRFAVGSSSLNCTDTNRYSSWRQNSVRLKTNISNLSEGLIKICLLARRLAPELPSGYLVQSNFTPTTYSFTLDRTPPEAPIFVNPETPIVTLDMPTISWMSSSTDTKYSLTVSNSSDCSTTTQSYSLTNNSQSLASLVDGTYFLCLKAHDKAGNASEAIEYPKVMQINTSNTDSNADYSVSWVRDHDLNVESFIDARTNPTKYLYGNAKELSGINYPDGAAEDYFYDNYGRLRQVTNARQSTSQYSFDDVGRVSNISFNTALDTDLSYEYRLDNLPNKVSDGTGTVTYEYYANKLVKAMNYDYTVKGLTNIQRIEYQYYPDDSIHEISWKSGANLVATWTYNYDKAGRVTTVASFGDSTTYRYDGQDQILSQTNSNGTETTYTYNNARRWPVSIAHKHNETIISQYALTYDAGANTVGNLTRVDESPGNFVLYSYNNLDRLHTESRNGQNAYSHIFEYDRAGNLINLNGTQFGAYDSANKITSHATAEITNDLDGNVTSYAGINFVWDTRNKLVSLTANNTTTSFGYDVFGNRTFSQVENNPPRFYIYSGHQLIGEIEGNAQLPSVAYTWGPDGLVAKRSIQEAQTYWYHFGPQGETRQITDNAGNIIARYLFDAYGKTLKSTGNIVNPYAYAGKFGYYSSDLANIMLIGSRWYSPNLKRWISRDPIKYKGGYNLYGYVEENPIKYVDPMGHDAVAINVGTAASNTLGSTWNRMKPILNGAAIGAAQGVAVAAGTVGGFIIGDCIYEGTDGCMAMLQGMCASDSKPTLADQAEALRRLCGIQYIDRLTKCQDQPDKQRCVEDARLSYEKCKNHAEGMRPITNNK